MADRAVRAHILITLVRSMVGPGQEEKIAAPILSDMDQGHIFRGPLVQLLEILRRLDRPFFDVADDVFGRRRRLQSQRSQPLAHGEYLSLIHISEPTRLLSISYAV